MRSRFLLLSLATLLCLTSPSGAAPRLSEFMAENKETLADEDGDFPDWIEIFNPDAAAVNLAGYALTDDALIPQKWIFPSVSVPGGGFLVVFASGKNRVNPAAALHTNFALETNGEYLALVAPDGTTKLTEFAPAFPVQEQDRSYGVGAPVTTATVIAPGAACRWIVPSAEITNWNTRTFTDAAWTAGQTGVGYERSPADAINYTALIGTGANVNAAMYNIRQTCYVRVPFTVANAADVFNMTLRMKHDDGFIAYVNGTKVAAKNDPATPLFNSGATAGQVDSDAVVFENYDASAFRSALVDGANVLAIHGLNRGATSSDFLILPQLELSAAASTLVTGYYPTPTPGSINGASVDGFVKDTVFSVDRGFFSAAFQVAITTTTPDAEIRYTTNGSAPTATTGSIYGGPLTISTTTVLRAAAFRTGWQPSNVDTQTYIFAAAVKNQPAAPVGFSTTWGSEYNFSTGVLDGPPVPADYLMDPAIANSALYGPLIIPAIETTLPVLSIVGDSTAIFGDANGIYSDGRLSELEVPASVEFFGPGSGVGFHARCGLRIHGGDALIEHPKKPFRLHFRREYGPAKLEFQFYPDADIKKFDRLQLRPGGHDGWAVPFGGTSNDLAFHATYIRDQFLRQTEIEQGRLSPQGRFAHLYINGLYWGFYNIHEVPGDDYFSSHYGGIEEDWDVIEQAGNPGYNVVDGNGEILDVMLALCTPATRPADPLIYDQIARYLDVDDFIDYMIVQIWAGQNDWMGPVFRGATDYSRFFNKNWNAGRLSRGPFETSFLFSSWDAEISMGTQLVSATLGHRISDFNHTRVGEPTPSFVEVGAPSFIYNALKSNADFRQRFSDRLHKHFFNGGSMTIPRNQARLAAMRSLLTLPIVAESARWGDVNGPDFTRDGHWIPEMDWMANTFLATRNGIVLGQFEAIGLFSTVDAPTYNQFGGLVGPGFQLAMTNPNAGGTIYYTTDGSDPHQQAGSVQTKLVTGDSPAKHWVPTGGVLGDTWKNVAEPANIGIWTDGTAAIGFDQGTSYLNKFSTDVSQMIGTNTSIYLRIPFTIESQAQLDSITALTLRMKYDDGCYVYLNGAGPVTRLNAPATAPVWNDATPAFHVDSEALIFESVDWTAQIPNLVVGTNWLCIQGINQTLASSDFLIVPELIITTGALAEGPSPAALAYAAPFALAQTGPVKARVLNGGVWSSLTDATFIVGVPATSANLVLSEFNYQPADPTAAEIAAGYTSGSDFEYLELHNPTASTLELAGLQFTAGVAFDFAGSAIQTLGPGGRVLIARNAAALAARHGAGLPIAGVFASGTGLSNAGERLTLLDATGTAIFDFEYEDNAPWPNPPADSGLSLVLVHPETFPDHALHTNWRLSRLPGGTPGGDDLITFPAWLAANGGTGSELSDVDEDSIVNLLEYALVGNPTQPSLGVLPAVAIEQFTPGGIPGSYLTVTFRRQRGAEDIAYHVEFGASLTAWNENGILQSEVEHLDGTTTEKWRSSVPVSVAASQFARVRIVR